MAESFISAEDELNFILGNDGEQLFDIDEALDDTVDLTVELPAESTAAIKYVGNLDCSMPAATSAAGAAVTPRSVATAAPMADDDDTNFNNDFGQPFEAFPGISRMVSLSPPPYGEQANTFKDLKDFNDPLTAFGGGDLMANFNPVEEIHEFRVDDINLDLSDDRVFPRYNSEFDMVPPSATFSLHRHLSGHYFPPISSQEKNNSSLLTPQQPRHYPNPYPSMNPPSHHRRPPIIHPPCLSVVRSRPLRKRKFQIPCSPRSNPVPITPDGSSASRRVIQGPPSFKLACEKATVARRARMNRRSRRARSQIIHLVAGGDIKEIKRSAAHDANYSTPLEEALLGDFSSNFDPKIFVDLAWEQVYEALVESCNPKEAKTVADLDLPQPESPAGPQPIQPVSDPSILTLPASVKEEAQVVTPQAIAGPDDKLKALPTGKDPESRKLRRLMRNRLSAQASRDRRKKAIDDKKKEKAEKEMKIALLEKTVAEEEKRVIMLEKAIEYAKEYLKPEQLARITSVQPSMVLAPRKILGH